MINNTGNTPILSLAITATLVVIVLSMVIPIPATVLDVGISFSIALATLILVMSALVEKPTDFQAFPVLLLVSLLIRLSLNVSSTRLILTDGHTGTQAAGDVISGFAAFVAGGTLSTGLTVFAVISIVNFMVITKGSGRMAEVSARFALDSLPGKQLAIDGDLSAGSITHEQAKKRRDSEQREISFFGSLDGASKFVKGDAIAGLVITLVNLLVGLAVGVTAHKMDVSSALSTYSQLTIGDGLVSQIPSLITSMAAALLLSRGGTTEGTAALLSGQLFQNWQAPALVSGAMLVMSVVPGMPSFVFIAISALLALMAWLVHRQSGRNSGINEQFTSPPTPVKLNELAEALDTDELSLEVAPDIVALVLDEGQGLGNRIQNLRMYIVRQFGVILPDVRITDGHNLKNGQYVIRVNGVIRGTGFLKVYHSLALGTTDVLEALDGSVVKEPVYDSPGCWILDSDHDAALENGATVVTPIEVLSTHLMEVSKQYLPEFLGQGSVMRLIEELKDVSDPARAERNKRYFASMFPDKVRLETLISVLRNLVEERVSIRNLTLIVDTLAEFRQIEQVDLLVEVIRKRLKGQISQQFSDESGQLNIFYLAPEWEERVARAETDTSMSAVSETIPSLGGKLSTAVRAALDEAGVQGRTAVIAVPGHRRRIVRDLLTAHGHTIPVMSLEEIDPGASLQLLGSVNAV